MVAKEDLLGPIGASGIGILTYLIGAGQRGFERGKRLKLERIIRSYTVARPSIGLSDQEKGYVRGMAALRAQEQITAAAYDAFLAEFAYGGGQCDVIPHPEWRGEKHEPEARRALHAVLGLLLPPYEEFLKKTANRVASGRHAPSPSGATIGTFLNQGSRWFEHGSPSDTFTTENRPDHLTIGWSPTGQPFRYGGAESSYHHRRPRHRQKPGPGDSEPALLSGLGLRPGREGRAVGRDRGIPRQAFRAGVPVRTYRSGWADECLQSV